MSMAVEYTGGREGTHSVTMTKPIGGGVIDIEHVPLDQINLYAQNGYMAMDTDGLFPHAGYCLNTPEPGIPDGIECSPATTTPVLFHTPTPTVTINPPQPTTAAHTAVTPHELPHVGVGGSDVLFALVVALAAFVAMARFGKQKRNGRINE